MSDDRRECGRRLLWVVAAIAVAVWAFGPQAALSHGGERHGGAKAEAPAPTTPAPNEPEPAEPEPAENAEPGTEVHDHAEGQTEAVESPSAHPYPPEGVPRPLAWLGKLHPLVTHFPVALLTMAALAELLLLRRPRELFHHAVRFCVWGGALGAVLAAILGWFFAGFRIVDDDWIMTSHRWVGTGTAAWAALVLLLSERTYRDGKDRRGFRLALLVGALLVGAAGFLGGLLIYGLDHYAW